MSDTDRITKLEQAMTAMTNHYWRFQGRINALETIAVQATLDFSKMQPEPFKFVQAYVAAMRVTSSHLLPDTDDPAKAERVISETKNAIDDFLADLLRHAGQLKGAPGNP